MFFYNTIYNKEVKPNHQCMVENDFEESDKFTIETVLGDYEQLVIANQYNQLFTINPNQLED